MAVSIYPEDAFVSDGIVLGTLRVAIVSGVIDRLADGVAANGEYPTLNPLRPEAVQILRRAGVIVLEAGRPSLSPIFKAVWSERKNWLLARLDFMIVAATDLLRHTHAMMLDPWTLQEVGSTFLLFDYSAAMTSEDAAIARCRPWVDYVTARTEAEAPFLMKTIGALVFEGCVLEVGGNSGAFARAMLHAGARSVSVIDLPAVCAIGEQIRTKATAKDRLQFIAGDARTITWPQPADAVVFKSVLHDWPDEDVNNFIERAISVLESDGTVIICERAPLDPDDDRPAILRVEDMVFAPFFREADYYASALARKGLAVAVDWPSSNLPYYVVSGRC